MTEETRALTLNSPAYLIHLHSFRAALVAALGEDKCSGVQVQGDGRVEACLREGTGVNDEALAQTVLDAHDPVFLSTDKASFLANDTDTATITVTALKPNAGPVVLLVAGMPVPVDLTDGIGTLELTSPDPANIPVTVQNPDNRSTDVISLEAR